VRRLGDDWRMRDLVVVGGGPAGAATAIVCARAGLDVLVLERTAALHDKPGETLHPGVEPLLERLGVADAVRAEGFIRHQGIRVAWDGPERFVPYGSDANGPWRGFQAWRARFDEVLLRAAAAAGATVRRGAHIDDRPRARWLVDASGGRHWLAKRLGLRIERHSVRLVVRHGYVEHAGGEAPLLRADALGWTWLAEVRPGLYQWTRLDLDGVSKTPVLVAGKLARRWRAADVTWRHVPECAGPGYFLVGDAAAVLDPSSSHGVLRALMTGMKAGQLITVGVRHPDPEFVAQAASHYKTWLAAWIMHDVSELKRLYARLPRVEQSTTVE